MLTFHLRSSGECAIVCVRARLHSLGPAWHVFAGNPVGQVIGIAALAYKAANSHCIQTKGKRCSMSSRMHLYPTIVHVRA